MFYHEKTFLLLMMKISLHVTLRMHDSETEVFEDVAI